MPIEPIKIPQNVQIADRIFGPVTLKQIIITGIGAGFSYAMYAMVSKAYGPPAIPLTIMIWSPTGVAAFFAFFQINGISMFQFLLLMIERINKPAIRAQTPRRGIVINLKTYTKAEDDNEHKPHKKKEIPNVGIDELSSVLDGPLHSKISAMNQEAPQVPATQEEVPTEENLESIMHEELPVNTKEDMEEQRNLSVNKTRIQANNVQYGTEEHPSVSIFRDLSPS